MQVLLFYSLNIFRVFFKLGTKFSLGEERTNGWHK